MLLAGAYSFLQESLKSVEEIPLSELVKKINANEVSKIVVRGDELGVSLTNGSEIIARKEAESSFSETLSNYGVSEEALSRVVVNVENPS